MAQNTQFSDIFKLFLNSISNDYRIANLFTDSPSVATDLLTTWLTQGAMEFNGCRVNFDEVMDFTNSTFTVELTLTEKVILSDLMILAWMEYNINNITQMSLTVQDRDFKTHAADRNLSAKVEYHDTWREKVYHKISEYIKKQHPISEWGSGGV